jgi:hypothetical protein
MAGPGYVNISSATTTVVKSGQGFFNALVINTVVASAITIYDNTSAAGQKIATLAASAPAGTYKYEVKFSTGLTILTAGASDLTVSFS